MDSAIGAAARALSQGDPLLALKYVALRGDAAALALRGIAMAQLGELASARRLLLRAERAFGHAEPLARARCILARAEVALARRDLLGAGLGLDTARELLAARGDHENALFAALLTVRRSTLLGQVDEARALLAQLALDRAPARLTALAALATAGLAIKVVDYSTAASALRDGRIAAQQAQIPQLAFEVERLEQHLESPVARLVCAGQTRSVCLRELGAFKHPPGLTIDACRREVRCGSQVVSLVRRPTLLELLIALGEHAPHEVTRQQLVERAFDVRRSNASHRVRLRVEIGRLRTLLSDLATLRATKLGYCLTPSQGDQVTVLFPPHDGQSSALLALLQSGETWATSALAAAIGKSQRAVQRALRELEGSHRVQSLGKGRAQRWVAAPAASSATALLLVKPI